MCATIHSMLFSSVIQFALSPVYVSCDSNPVSTAALSHVLMLMDLVYLYICMYGIYTYVYIALYRAWSMISEIPSTFDLKSKYTKHSQKF